MSNYFCSAEWHLKQQMGEHITVAALLYPWALGIAQKSGTFYCSGEQVAKYFSCSPTTLYAAIQLLEDLGFFFYIETLPDRRKKYEVLTHKQWATAHPGKCTIRQPAGGIIEQPAVESLDNRLVERIDNRLSTSLRVQSPSSLRVQSPTVRGTTSPDVQPTRPLESKPATKGNRLPLLEMGQAVLEETGHKVFFPPRDYERYQALLREFSGDELIQAVRDSCNSLGDTFNYRGFSGWFLQNGCGDIILRANREMEPATNYLT